MMKRSMILLWPSNQTSLTKRLTDDFHKNGEVVISWQHGNVNVAIPKRDVVSLRNVKSVAKKGSLLKLNSSD